VGDSSPGLAVRESMTRTRMGTMVAALGASSCSSRRREEKGAIFSGPDSSRAGPRAASPYYHLGRYRGGTSSAVLMLPLGVWISELRPDGGSGMRIWWGNSTRRTSSE
jgi:hypothetical protein